MRGSGPILPDLSGRFTNIRGVLDKRDSSSSGIHACKPIIIAVTDSWLRATFTIMMSFKRHIVIFIGGTAFQDREAASY